MMALYLISGALGISPYFTLPPILIGGFFVGVALYWIAVHRMMGRPPLMSLLSTFSVNLVLVGLADNREAAELVGIPTTRVLAIAVGCGVALAGVSGMLIGTLFPFTILSGDGYQLKSFVVTVLGGFGNPVGALMGGVALGLLEGAVTPFVPVSWTLVIEFVLFVLVLIAFPGGVFARRGTL
jgi:branched-subunit amino acid ABC-type transport system permease component